MGSDAIQARTEDIKFMDAWRDCLGRLSGVVLAEQLPSDSQLRGAASRARSGSVHEAATDGWVVLDAGGDNILVRVSANPELNRSGFLEWHMRTDSVESGPSFITRPEQRLVDKASVGDSRYETEWRDRWGIYPSSR